MNKEEVKTAIKDKGHIKANSFVLISQHDLSSLIDQLDEPYQQELKDLKSVKEYYEILVKQVDELAEVLFTDFGIDPAFTTEVTKFTIDLLGKLKSEKPVVPQFVAEWIEQDKQPSLSHGLFYLYSLLNDRSWVENQKLLNWLKLDKENEKKFAIAYYVGCEVEKEPLLHMPVPYLEGAYYRNDDLKELTSFKKDSKFTQTELDERFPDIKHMAVEVKG